MHKSLKVKLSSKNYDVKIGEGILAKCPQFIRKGKGPYFSKNNKGFIFADRKLTNKVRELEKSLMKNGWEVHVYFLTATEKLKSFESVYPLYEKLLNAGADRGSVIFALGGGTIGDAIGFLASTYMRGIRWVSIPTTLLSQVDSGLGGKTGINHDHGKNLIGQIWQPDLVLVDTHFLKTLRKRDMVSGYGEILKYGLSFDVKILKKLMKFKKTDWHKITPDMTQLIYRCLKAKILVVQEDERDILGKREVLNFGHTFGHALEKMMGYDRLRHGEAVVWGMRYAIILSKNKGVLSERKAYEALNILSDIPLPSLPYTFTDKELLKIIKLDKKNISGKVRFVLLKDLGECRTGVLLKKETLLKSFHEMVELVG